MRYLIAFLLSLAALTVSAVPYDTNDLNAALSDEYGVMAYPTNATYNGLALTNYGGGNYILSLGATPYAPANASIYYTNYGSGASIMVGTNAHVTISDQYGTQFKTGTNGVWSIVGTNGVSMVETNGVFTLSSNGLPFGVVSAGAVTSATFKGISTTEAPIQGIVSNSATSILLYAHLSNGIATFTPTP